MQIVLIFSMRCRTLNGHNFFPKMALMGNSPDLLHKECPFQRYQIRLVTNFVRVLSKSGRLKQWEASRWSGSIFSQVESIHLTRSISTDDINKSGMWSGLETVSRTNNVSSRTKCSTPRSCLGLGPIRLGPRVGLGPKHLGVSGYFMSLVETFCAACAQYSCRRPIQTNLP